MHYFLITMFLWAVPNVAVFAVCGAGFWFQWFMRGAIWWTLMLVGNQLLTGVIGGVLHGNAQAFALSVVTGLFLVVVARRWYKGLSQAWRNLPGWASIRRAERRSSSYNLMGPP